MENRCVCCGAVVPEGRMVCPMCEMAADEGVYTSPGSDRLKKGICEREDVPETLRAGAEALLAGGE